MIAIVFLITTIGVTAGCIAHLHDLTHKLNALHGISNKWNKIAAITGIISLFTFVYINKIICENNYKQGQIDALTGHIKYELKTQPDRSVEWVEITTYVK